MTIVLTYHSLVERDTRFVSRKWLFSIVFLLSGIAVLSLVAGFTIHALDSNYKDNCFIDSQIVFKTVPDELIIYDELDKNTKKSSPIISLYDVVRNEEDLYVFEHTSIDELETTWGDSGNCIFISLSPLFFSFCAIVWICMFITCGHGGKTKSYIAEKPWTIVVPSLVFFISASIATFILLMFVKTTIDNFCEQLDEYLYDEYYCGFLLAQFSLYDEKDSNFSRDYYSIVLRSLIITNVLWIICAIIMIVRIIFVIDFQLVRVTISLMEPTVTVGRNMQVINEGGGGFDDKQDYDKQDYDKQDYVKQDYDKQDYVKQDYDKQDYDKQDYNKQDYDKQDYDKQDYDKQDYDKQDYDKQDYDKQDYDKQDYDKQDNDKQDYDKQDYDKQDYDKQDYDKQDYHKQDYDNQESHNNQNYQVSVNENYQASDNQAGNNNQNDQVNDNEQQVDNTKQKEAHDQENDEDEDESLYNWLYQDRVAPNLIRVSFQKEDPPQNSK